MATSVQCDSGGSKDAATDPRMYLQLGNAGACLLARSTSWYRMRRQVCWWEHCQVHQNAVHESKCKYHDFFI